MIELRLEHDWYCTPVWWNVHDGELVGEVDREDLPISDSLWAMLIVWSERMDAMFSHQDPRESGFKTEFELQEWIAEGHKLWLKLREEMGPGYRIEYRTYRNGTRKPEHYPLPR